MPNIKLQTCEPTLRLSVYHYKEKWTVNLPVDSLTITWNKSALSKVFWTVDLPLDSLSITWNKNALYKAIDLWTYL